MSIHAKDYIYAEEAEKVRLKFTVTIILTRNREEHLNVSLSVMQRYVPWHCCHWVRHIPRYTRHCTNRISVTNSTDHDASVDNVMQFALAPLLPTQAVTFPGPLTCRIITGRKREINPDSGRQPGKKSPCPRGQSLVCSKLLGPEF
jgi:hypothetical protein